MVYYPPDELNVYITTESGGAYIYHPNDTTEVTTYDGYITNGDYSKIGGGTPGTPTQLIGLASITEESTTANLNKISKSDDDRHTTASNAADTAIVILKLTLPTTIVEGNVVHIVPEYEGYSATGGWSLHMWNYTDGGGQWDTCSTQASAVAAGTETRGWDLTLADTTTETAKYIDSQIIYVAAQSETVNTSLVTDLFRVTVVADDAAYVYDNSGVYGSNSTNDTDADDKLIFVYDESVDMTGGSGKSGDVANANIVSIYHVLDGNDLRGVGKNTGHEFWHEDCTIDDTNTITVTGTTDATEFVSYSYTGDTNFDDVVVPALPREEWHSNGAHSGQVVRSFTDVTGCDISPVVRMQDIDYLGINQTAKVTIKSDNEITITMIKSNDRWSELYGQARFGANTGTAPTLFTNRQPLANWGYRLYIRLNEVTTNEHLGLSEEISSRIGGNNEWLTFKGCWISNYTTTPNTDGVLEETITFQTKIPFVQQDRPDITPVQSSEL